VIRAGSVYSSRYASGWDKVRSGSVGAQAGDIKIDATGVTVVDSDIINAVQFGALGNGAVSISEQSRFL